MVMDAASYDTTLIDCRLRALSQRLFDELRERSFDGVGISRETYGPGETVAMNLIEVVASQHDLETEWDGAQNLIVRLPGCEPDLPVVATGSHLDSVPQGGNFDGAAGVIAGLAALIAAKLHGPHRRSLELHVLRGEESAWYGGPCYFGSRAMFGLLEDADLCSQHRHGQTTLAEKMAACGVDIERVQKQMPFRQPCEFHAWIELHIEQGPLLVAREKPIGIVTGIRGNVRHRRVICKGQPAHSGAVPRWLRHDAVLAMSDLLMRLDEHWRVLLAWGEDLVLTAGIVETDPKEHAVSRVPGQVSFAVEYRSQDQVTLDGFANLLQTECENISTERGVAFELGVRSVTKPASMSADLVALVEEQARAAAVDYEIMPSGAGHDTAVFANSGIPSTMIFIRNENGSHNPNEQMDMDDFIAGAEVLARAVIVAANAKEDVHK